jgi:PHP family Zn ribbon phosphoesterase
MSPRNIISKAIERGIDIIGISDHNSTLQCGVVKKIGQDRGLFVLCGAEVTSREEVHSLAFFENDEYLLEFQHFIDRHLAKIKNDIRLFGDQLLVDENDVILQEVDNLLSASLDVGIDVIEKYIHQLNGVFIPSHINRGRNSLLSQLAFIPEDLNADALEIDKKKSVQELLEKHPQVKEYTLLKNSDSHQIDMVGKAFSEFSINELNFNEIRMALRNEKGRKVIVEF